MEALFIFMGLLMMSMAYNYGNQIDYGPRYGLHTRSRTQFARTTFGPPPFRRPSFRNRFPRASAVYIEKYLRERSTKPSPLPWLRKNNPEITISDTPTEIPKNPKASLSIFGKLTTEQINATLVTNKATYPWIARVVATPEDTAPGICTAACIEERIFVTAATCLLNAKVYYTRVYYQDVALQPLAFVLPSKPTKAMFHDLGLIVVNKNFTKPWHIVKSYYKENKIATGDDETFLWTDIITHRWWTTMIVGYVGEDSEKEDYPNKPNNTVYSLYELVTMSSPFLCNYLHNKHLPSDKFFVPCYSACFLNEYHQNISKCYNYLAGEGHIVVGQHTKEIMGVATWGGHYKKGLNRPPLPVGFATTNSLAFEQDWECARKIAKAPEASERFDTFCQ